MKFTGLFLVIPLALGSGAAWADSTTSTTETTTSRPSMPSTATTSSNERIVTPSGKLVDKSKTTTDRADGSSTTNSSKTVVRP